MLRKLKGFTLIELLIVIAIIAILTVAFLPTLRGGQAGARDAARVQLVNNISIALENMINSGTTTLPVDGGAAATGGCVENYNADTAGVAFKTAMGLVPQSYTAIATSGTHLCSGQYVWYNQIGLTNSYILAIELEAAKGANVEAGVTATNITGYDTVSAVLGAIDQSVGAGDASGTPATDSKYYYMMAR